MIVMQRRLPGRIDQVFWPKGGRFANFRFWQKSVEAARQVSGSRCVPAYDRREGEKRTSIVSEVHCLWLPMLLARLDAFAHYFKRLW